MSSVYVHVYGGLKTVPNFLALLLEISAGVLLAHCPILLCKLCAGLTTSDPGGYTAVDVLVGGSQGHVVAVGVVLGLRAIGAL
jgi:Photosystem I psaG / psaK